MISHVINFKDEVSGQGAAVFVHTSHVHDPDESKKGSNGLYLRLEVASGWDYTDAYIPRNQVEEIIKALKEVLNEE